MTKFKILILVLLISGSMNAQKVEDGIRAMESDKFEGARDVLKEITYKEPNNGDAYYYLGQTYIALFKNDSARISFQKGTEVEKSNGTNFAGLGQLKLAEDKAQEAMGLFEQAIAAKKKSVKSNRAVSLAYLTAGEKYLDAALQYADAAMALDNRDVENYILLGDIYLEKKEAGKAATNYERGISVNPNDPEPLVKVANIWLRVRNLEACKESIDKALALDQNYAPAHKTLSKLYYLTKQYDKAKTEYTTYLDLSERSAANLRQYANVLFLGELYKEALPIIDQLILNDFDDIYLYRLKAYSIYEIAKAEKMDSIAFYNEGKIAMEIFLSKAPVNKILSSDYSYYGKTLSEMGQDSLAIQTLMKIVEKDSTNSEIYYEIAMINYNAKKYAEAAVYFQKAIDNRVNPMVLDYFYAGRCYFYSNQYGKADTAYIHLLELKPDYYDAYLQRGNANASLDPEYKDTIAKSMFESFIELTKNDTDKYKKGIITSYTYLAVYAVQHDDNTSGTSYLKKILEIDPKNETATNFLKQLQPKK